MSDTDTSMTKIKLSDWTRFPGGRFARDGANSGETFRKRFIEGQEGPFEIDFTDVFAVSWGFADEAFGYYMTELGEKEFKKRFCFKADDDPAVLQDLQTMIDLRCNSRVYVRE